MCEQRPTPLVTGHPYQPSAWPWACGHQEPDGWFCGHAEGDHAERPEGAAKEVGPNATP